MPFAQRCGVHDAARDAACAQLLQRVQEGGVEQVRIGWCDLHGMLRGKTLMPTALPAAATRAGGQVGDRVHRGIPTLAVLAVLAGTLVVAVIGVLAWS